MIKLKPLVWVTGESISHSFPDPIFVSINDIAEFAILVYNGDPDESDDDFKLEITFGGGHWDCFHYPTIEQCKDRAQDWLQKVIEDLITPETAAQ